AFRTALAIGEQLIAELPAVPEYRQAQADCHINVADMHIGKGRRRDAEPAVRKAITLLEPLVATFPQARDSRRSLARAQMLAARLSGESAVAISASRKAIDLLNQLVAESPDREDRLTLAQGYNSLANRLRSTSAPEEVAKVYGNAVAILRQLADEFPTVARFRLDLAILLMNWATFLTDTKRLSEAEPHLR